MTYIIVGRKSCPYCIAAKKLLHDKRLPYEFHNIETFDKTSTLWKKKPSEHKTVPVIFYAGKFIGGYSELCQFVLK